LSLTADLDGSSAIGCFVPIPDINYGRALGSPSTGSRIVSGHRAGTKTRDISQTRTSSKPYSQGTSSREALGHRQPTTSGVPQEDREQTASDKKLKELDEALDKKMKSICRAADFDRVGFDAYACI
jgi:hypothetical protein